MVHNRMRTTYVWMWNFSLKLFPLVFSSWPGSRVYYYDYDYYDYHQHYYYYYFHFRFESTSWIIVLKMKERKYIFILIPSIAVLFVSLVSFCSTLLNMTIIIKPLHVRLHSDIVTKVSKKYTHILCSFCLYIQWKICHPAFCSAFTFIVIIIWNKRWEKKSRWNKMMEFLLISNYNFLNQSHVSLICIFWDQFMQMALICTLCKWDRFMQTRLIYVLFYYIICNRAKI